MDTLASLFFTADSIPLTIIRVGLAIVLFPHGAQKLFGWFNGPGLKGSMYYFTKVVMLPSWVGVLVIIIELAGSVLLFLGLGTRAVAFAVIILFCGIIRLLKPNGFFMNWTGDQKGEGIEFGLLVIAIALSLLIGGGGAWSLDYALFNPNSN